MVLEQTSPFQYTTAGASTTTTFGSATASGRFILVYCGTFDNGGPGAHTITDNKGNIYSISVDRTSGSQRVGWYYCASIVGGASHIITATPVNGPADTAIQAFEISDATGIAQASDSTGTNSPSGVASVAGTIDSFYFWGANCASAISGLTMTWSGATQRGLGSYDAIYSNSAISGTQTPSLAFTGGGAWIDALVRVEFIRNPVSMGFVLGGV